MTGVEPRALAYGALVAAVAAALLHAAQGQGVPWPWLAVWGLEFALLALQPWWPLAGLSAYAAVQYAVSSHGGLHDQLLSMRGPDAMLMLALLGWRLFRRPSDQALWRPRGVWLSGALLLVWAGISLGSALAQGGRWGPFPRHDPSVYLQCAAVFLIAADTLRSRSAGLAMAGILVLVVAVRAALQGAQGIYLESYIATLAVMTAPLAALVAWLLPGSGWRWLFAAAVPGLLSVVALTQNRAAAVAVLAGLLAGLGLWLSAQVRRWWVWGACVIAVLALAWWLGQGGRFRALVDPAAVYATADLDRATAQERLALWRAGWDMARQSPWLGTGPGNYPAQLQYVQPGSEPLAAHSSYVQILAETGFPGLLLYLLFFLQVMVVLARCARTAPSGSWRRPVAQMLVLSLVAYLAGGLFNSRHDLALAYLLAGWGCAVAGRTDALGSGRPA